MRRHARSGAEQCPQGDAPSRGDERPAAAPPAGAVFPLRGRSHAPDVQLFAEPSVRAHNGSLGSCELHWMAAGRRAKRAAAATRRWRSGPYESELEQSEEKPSENQFRGARLLAWCGGSMCATVVSPCVVASRTVSASCTEGWCPAQMRYAMTNEELREIPEARAAAMAGSWEA